MKIKQPKEQYIASARQVTLLFKPKYIYRRNDFCKKFNTSTEQGFAQMHEIEYAEYGLKVRAKRSNALITENEDLSSCVPSLGKCWKHRSRRSHQWKDVKVILSMFD